MKIRMVIENNLRTRLTKILNTNLLRGNENHKQNAINRHKKAGEGNESEETFLSNQSTTKVVTVILTFHTVVAVSISMVIHYFSILSLSCVIGSQDISMTHVQTHTLSKHSAISETVTLSKF